MYQSASQGNQRRMVGGPNVNQVPNLRNPGGPSPGGNNLNSNASRVPQLLDEAKGEFENLLQQLAMYKHERNELERNLSNQVQEMELIQQTLAALENQHRACRRQYEDDMLRMRHQLGQVNNASGASGLKRTREENERLAATAMTRGGNNNPSATTTSTPNPQNPNVSPHAQSATSLNTGATSLASPSLSKHLGSQQGGPSTLDATRLPATSHLGTGAALKHPNGSHVVTDLTGMGSGSGMPRSLKLGDPGLTVAGAGSMSHHASPQLVSTSSHPSTTTTTTSSHGMADESQVAASLTSFRKNENGTSASMSHPSIPSSLSIGTSGLAGLTSRGASGGIPPLKKTKHEGSSLHDGDALASLNEVHHGASGLMMSKDMSSYPLASEGNLVHNHTTLHKAVSGCGALTTSSSMSGPMSSSSSSDLTITSPLMSESAGQTHPSSLSNPTPLVPADSPVSSASSLVAAGLSAHATSTALAAAGGNGNGKPKIKWSYNYNTTISTMYPETERPHVELHKTLDHQSVVCCVRFSKDGSMMASGCHKTAQVFDVASGDQIFNVSRPAAPALNGATENEDAYVRAVCFSPDGKKVVAGMPQQTIRLWDIESKQEELKLIGHESEIYSLDYVNNLIASGSGDRKVRLWDATSGVCHSIFGDESTGPSDGVTSVTISPDGRLLAAASLDKIVRIWDITTSRLIDRLEGHSDSVYSIAFSPDGKNIISGSLDRSIMLWDVSASGNTTNRPRLLFQGHKDFVLSVAFTPDGRWLMSGSKDRTVVFWDPRSTRSVLTLTGYRNSVISVASSPASPHFATGSGDCFACIWKYQCQTM